MTISNGTIWQAGAFSDKRSLKVLCGPRTFRWKGLITRVEYVLVEKRKLVVVVSASGSDPRKPSEQDTLNAQLAALIVKHQRRFKISRSQISVYLLYGNSTRVEVDVNIRNAELFVDNYRKTSRLDDTGVTLPTPVLSYLATRHRF